MVTLGTVGISPEQPQKPSKSKKNTGICIAQIFITPAFLKGYYFIRHQVITTNLKKSYGK